MTGWFFANMAWASALMLAVLLIRRPFARTFGAGPAYALWLLPALRLAIPPLPAWPAHMPAMLPSETLVIWIDDTGASLPAATAESWLPALLALWALGAIGLIAWQWAIHRRFLARLFAGARAIGDHRGLPLIESAAVNGPLAIGLVDRRIVVPADFATRYSPQERTLALAHETVHHRRGDIWWNHLAIAILALNWFNPIAWIAFRAFRADQELACDAVVTADADAEARRDYARALVKASSRPGIVAACPLNGTEQLKRRLKMVKDHRRSRAQAAGGGAAIALLAGIGLTLGAPGLAGTPDGDDGRTPPAREQGGATADAAGDEDTRILIRIEREERRREGADRPDTERDRNGDAPAAAERVRREQREVIVLTRPAGDEGEDASASDETRAGSERERRMRRILLRPGDVDSIRLGSGGGALRIGGRETIVLPDCATPGEPRVEADGEGTRRRVIICERGGTLSGAERAAGLRRARERLAQNDRLDAQSRERVLAALDAAIAEASED